MDTPACRQVTGGFRMTIRRALAVRPASAVALAATLTGCGTNSGPSGSGGAASSSGRATGVTSGSNASGSPDGGSSRFLLEVRASFEPSRASKAPPSFGQRTFSNLRTCAAICAPSPTWG